MQKLAYDYIIHMKKLKLITKTGESNMQETIKEIGEMLKVYLTEVAIWKGLKGSNIRRNISDFLWKLLQGRLKIGMF